MDGVGRRAWATCALFLFAGLCLGIAATLLVSERRAMPASDPGQVDIGFAQDMTQHHAQALQMSEIALTGDASPTIEALARRILVSQAKEIGVLGGWLTLWAAPQLPAGPPMTWMRDGQAMHHGTGNRLMPGMATPAQLSRLSRLTGADLDAEFLTLMTRHHLGGIDMAAYAAAHARLSEVRSLAARMMKDQTQEVAAFRRLSAAQAGAR